MRTRECGNYEFSSPRMSGLHLHACEFFIDINGLVHVREIKPGIDTEHHHVNGKSNKVNVTGSFTVSEKSTLYPVTACHESEL